MVGDLYVYTQLPARRRRRIQIRYYDEVEMHGAIQHWMDTHRTSTLRAHRIIFVDAEARMVPVKDKDKPPEHETKAQA